MNSRTKSINYMVKVAMLGTLSYLVMLLQFPLLPAAPFLKMDFSNVITLIGGFALGPMASLIIDSIRLMFDCLIDGTTTGFVGEFSAWLLGITYCVPSSIIYKYRRNIKGAFVAIVVAFVLSNCMGIISNKFIMFPLFGIPAEAINGMLVSAVLPFNAIKYSIVSVIVLLVYKPLSPIIKKQYTLHSKTSKNKSNIDVCKETNCQNIVNDMDKDNTNQHDNNEKLL